MATPTPSPSATLPPPPAASIAPERRVEPRSTNVLAVAGGLLALMVLLMAVQAFAWHYQETSTDGGIAYVIPLGASAALANPEMDSAIAIPTRIVFAAGDPAILTIRNEDTEPNRAGPWELGPGQTYTVRFDKPGTYEYTCTMNPAESVTVIVEGDR